MPHEPEVLDWESIFDSDDTLIQLPAPGANGQGGTSCVERVIVFDIETSPLPSLHLDRIRPPFDRESVKDARCKPETLEKKRDEAEANWVSTFAEKAALSPLTGTVLCIGHYAIEADAKPVLWERKSISTEDEADLLDTFWHEFSDTRAEGGRLVGFNCHEFDVPFLIRRSWILGVPVPPGVFDARGFLSPVFVDLLRIWKCGGRFGDPPHVNSKLATICRCFGLGEKLDGLDGSDFHKLWHGTKEEREKARAYAVRDLELTYMLAKRMGVAP